MADRRHRRADKITKKPGAYLLFIELVEPCPVVRPGRQTILLPPGLYAYCGSAYGPGGLRARITRHLKRQKTIRWHIDQLTVAGTVVQVQATPGGNECTLLRQLLSRKGIEAPIPGFGSSDCATCVAHLLTIPAEHKSLLDSRLRQP